jgi:hypothetical protein
MHSLAGRLPAMRHRFLLILALGLCCLGMGQKKLPLSIRFYSQTSANDTSSFSSNVTLLDGRQTTIDDIAEISERDIVAVYPFPVADGSGGLALMLNDHGTIALDSLSSAKRGTILIATVNGRQVADILVDKRVTDGIVTIPGGINTDEMRDILKRYPVIGKKKVKKKDVYSAGM